MPLNPRPRCTLMVDFAVSSTEQPLLTVSELTSSKPRAIFHRELAIDHVRSACVSGTFSASGAGLRATCPLRTALAGTWVRCSAHLRVWEWQGTASGQREASCRRTPAKVLIRPRLRSAAPMANTFPQRNEGKGTAENGKEEKTEDTKKAKARACVCVCVCACVYAHHIPSKLENTTPRSCVTTTRSLVWPQRTCGASAKLD